MQNHAHSLRLIQGGPNTAPPESEQPIIRGESYVARQYGRSPTTVYSVLLRFVAGTTIASAVTGDKAAPAWSVLDSVAPASITFGITGSRSANLVIHCVIDPVDADTTRLSLIPEIAAGGLFRRNARRHLAEQLCETLLSSATVAIAQHAGRAAVRRAEREQMRSAALLLMHGTTFKGELCDLSEGGAAVSIPRHVVADWSVLEQQVGTSGTLITRLNQAHVTLDVSIVRLWPADDGMRIGMELT